MSKTFRQADKQWGSMGYPKSPDTMANSGCGATACADIIVNNPAYANITPKEVGTWMVKQGYAIKGAGTAWNGITACMKHYGFNVVNHASMDTVWKAMEKGDTWGIILFRAGSKGGVTWTTCGHFVAFSAYKYENKQHFLYTRDPAPRKNDGWHSYEKTMCGLIPQIWTFTLPKAVASGTTPAPKVSTESSSCYMTHTNWKKVQTWLGCNATGYVAGQSSQYKNNYYDLADIQKNVDGTGKSDTIKAMQCWLDQKQTGLLTPAFIKVLQKKIGTTADGIWGENTSKAFIVYIGKNAKPNLKKEKDTRLMRFIDGLEAYGRDIEKEFKYSNSNSKTTWAEAKKNHIANCARYVSWALQYCGVLSSGKCIYCTTSLLGSGATQFKSSKYIKFSTPKKTVTDMAKAGELKRGDICMFTNGKHTMVVYNVDKKTGKVTWYSAGSSDIKAKKVRNRVRDEYQSRKVAYLGRIVD